MSKATVTGKGQITLPSDIRKALDIKAGDKLFFEVNEDVITARVLPLQDIDALFNALPGVDRYAGAEAERDAYHQALVERNATSK